MADDAGFSPAARPSRAMQVLIEAEAQVAMMPKAFDAFKLASLQAHVSTFPGFEGRGAGEVATSLHVLLRRLQSGGCCDREALSVHVRAWRLMMTAPPEPEVVTVLLEGLKQICDLYPEARPA